MPDKPEVSTTTKLDKRLENTTKFITSKRTRGAVFLVISFILVLGINAILPVIEGESHYTAGAVTMTYGDYVEQHGEDEHIRLTWGSEQKIGLYIHEYIDEHPELSADEQMLVTVPDMFPVSVYTKFFFQHSFWYISTAVSIGSSLILFYSLFNYLIVLMKDRYAPYVDLDTEMREGVKKHLDPVSFEPWMENVFNTHRKIQQHRANIKYAIDKLERKTKYTVKRRLRPYFDAVRRYGKASESINDAMEDKYHPINILHDLGTLTKAEERYLVKKEKYLDLLGEDYIAEYVISGEVQYFQYVYPMFVYNGENTSGKTIDSYSMIKTDAQQIGSDAAARVSLSLALTFLFASLATITVIAAYDQSPLWIIINIISRIVPLVIQVVFSYSYSNEFMVHQLIGNLLNRRAIMLLYLADMKKEGIENAKTNLT